MRVRVLGSHSCHQQYLSIMTFSLQATTATAAAAAAAAATTTATAATTATTATAVTPHYLVRMTSISSTKIIVGLKIPVIFRLDCSHSNRTAGTSLLVYVSTIVCPTASDGLEERAMTPSTGMAHSCQHSMEWTHMGAELFNRVLSKV